MGPGLTAEQSPKQQRTLGTGTRSHSSILGSWDKFSHTMTFIGWIYFHQPAMVTVKYKEDLTEHFNTFPNEKKKKTTTTQHVFHLLLLFWLYHFEAIRSFPLKTIPWVVMLSQMWIVTLFITDLFSLTSCSQEHLDIAAELDVASKAPGIIFASNCTCLFI